MQYIYQINYNIDIISKQLNEINDAITLAKLNIVSKHILHPIEIDNIKNHFSKQNLNFESIQQIYEILELQAYYNHSKIIFNIQTPLFQNNVYSFIHLIPLTINKTKMVSIKFPFIAHNDRAIYGFTEKCLLVQNIFICKDNMQRTATNDSRCVGNIIQNIEPYCDTINMPYSTWILQPEENYLVTINIPKTAMESTCDYNNKHIEGTSLIHFENCTIFINNLTYSSQQFLEWDSIHIIPVNNIEIKEAQVINNMSLETLSKYHFKKPKSNRINFHQITSS